MDKGDIVLVTFPFTDLSGTKLRPAIILIESSKDITVCFVTTQILQWQEHNDILIDSTLINGLLKRSLIRTSKIATLDKSLAKGLLGKLTSNEINELNTSLRSLFQL